MVAVEVLAVLLFLAFVWWISGVIWRAITGQVRRATGIDLDPKHPAYPASMGHTYGGHEGEHLPPPPPPDANGYQVYEPWNYDYSLPPQRTDESGR